MAFDVPYGKSVSVPFSFVDANGNAAKVDGMPVVASTLGEVVVALTDTGFSATLTIGAVGSATLSGTADVDLGEGVKELGFALGDFNGLASPEAASVTVGEPAVI
jgi:hypothetical protein